MQMLFIGFREKHKEGKSKVKHIHGGHVTNGSSNAWSLPEREVIKELSFG